MTDWFNRQNKECIPLMESEYMLNQSNGISWLPSPLFKLNRKLNKKVSRISPRRPKAVLVELLKNSLSVNDIGDLIESDHDDL